VPQKIELCAGICEYTAQSAPQLLQDEERELPNGGNGLMAYSPIGVVYGIQPWNFPAYQVIRYAVASLMAGNGVLLKYAGNVTGSALLLEQLFQKAGLPADIFKVLLIDHDQSDKVIEHELVRGVTLTGSPGASLIHAKDDEDALRIANDSRFGLGGGIFSKNPDRARQLARDLGAAGHFFPLANKDWLLQITAPR
jgi:succinate-semialdehyde dehydrogenase/glutarate-semialdehyde dehydrogenase